MSQGCLRLDDIKEMCLRPGHCLPCCIRNPDDDQTKCVGTMQNVYVVYTTDILAVPPEPTATIVNLPGKHGNDSSTNDDHPSKHDNHPDHPDHPSVRDSSLHGAQNNNNGDDPNHPQSKNVDSSSKVNYEAGIENAGYVDDCMVISNKAFNEES
jgi:hypothetical protein